LFAVRCMVMQPARLRLGQLLIDARILTLEQLDKVLAVQKTDNRKLGTLLVESGVISETQLTQVLSQQLSVPWVSLHHIDFSRELLNRIPRELAEKYCLVPIYVRAVRGQGNTLYVAMEDPMHEEAVAECATAAGLPVRAMIAAPTDIRKAVRLYYTSSTAPAAASPGRSRPPPERSSRRPSRPGSNRPQSKSEGAAVGASPTPVTPPRTPPPPSASVASVGKGALPPPRSIAPPPPPSRVTRAREEDDAPELEVHEIEIPRRGRRADVEMTLLDGTQLKVPNSRRGTLKTAQPEDGLTVAELMAALRGEAQGSPAAPGKELRVEKVMAAVLSLLMRKHLVFERELLEELKKI
jgi:type IV pilus assembly protein PilB